VRDTLPQAAQGGLYLGPAELRVVAHAMERSTGFATCEDQAGWLILSSRIEAALAKAVAR
jgi:hypothetical protein